MPGPGTTDQLFIGRPIQIKLFNGINQFDFHKKNILRSVREAERKFPFQMSRPGKRRNWELPTK